MNKIYSKVWNKTLGQLVVASELASSDSVGATGSSRAVALQGFAPLCWAIALVLGLSGSAWAESGTAGGTGAADSTAC